MDQAGLCGYSIRFRNHDVYRKSLARFSDGSPAVGRPPLRMNIKILGSAAGGGFPQWNCNCPNCRDVRAEAQGLMARTQSSIAISTNGADWLLVNASPDILAQIRANPELQPARHTRDTGIAAILLTDAQLDHVTGLLMLREHHRPWPLYTTASVRDDLSGGFPVVSVLDHYCSVTHYPLPLDGSPVQGLGFLDGVRISAVPLDSKAPPWSPSRTRSRPGDNIGLVIENTVSGKRVFYAPGLGDAGPEVRRHMQAADLLLVDGTLWSDDEMIQCGLSGKTASDMGHLALSGPGGMIELLDSVSQDRRVRKVLVHINNSNPVLRDGSPQRAVLQRHGIEVGRDGMSFTV